VAQRRIESVLKKVRPGARTLLIRVDASEVIDTLVRWSRVGRAPHELVRGPAGTELRIYLLPREFDGHPLVAWRPALGPASELEAVLAR